MAASLWRFAAVATVAQFALASAIECAEASGATLIDFAPTAAIFEADGRLHRVSVGQPVPGTTARLLHIGRLGVEVEYAASPASPALVARVERGGPLSERQADFVNAEALRVPFVTTVKPGPRPAPVDPASGTPGEER